MFFRKIRIIYVYILVLMQVYFATNLSSVIGIDEPVASVGQ